MWTPPARIKLSSLTAAKLRSLVASTSPLVRKMKLAILTDGPSSAGALTLAQQKLLRNAAAELYKFIPVDLIPLTAAQSWANAGAWGDAAPPHLDSDDRLGWVTFADPVVVLNAIDLLKPVAQLSRLNVKKLPANVDLAAHKPTISQSLEEVPRETGPNEDIKGLIHSAYVFSQLPPSERAKNTWAAGIVVGRLIDQAKPAEVQKAREELVFRWDKDLKAASCKPTDNALDCAKKVLEIIFDPWWWLRSDDGKSPVIRIVAESAVTNPDRPLAAVLGGFNAVKPEDRPALADSVRAFLTRAFEGALGPARIQYIDLMRSRHQFNWPKDPWAAVLPYEGQDPPAKILVANQGKTKDGGIFDDPSDDTAWEKLKFYAQDTVRTWDPSILQTNPLAQFAEWTGEKVDEAGGLVKDAAKEVYGGLVKPLVLVGGGVAILVVAAIALRS